MQKQHIDDNHENGPYTSQISVVVISISTKEATRLYEDIAQRFKWLSQDSDQMMHLIEADKTKAPRLRMLIDRGQE